MTWLFSPGPVMLPEGARLASFRQMVSHRSEEFSRVYRDVLGGLKGLLEGRGEVVLLPCSGTGAMEAALLNLFPRGARVAVLSCGHFGERFAQVASRLGLEVKLLAEEDGMGLLPERVLDFLRSLRGVEGVLVTHSETSTGVLNDLRGVASAAREVFPEALVVADCVSSLGACPVLPDEWGVDAVVSASQKALMAPPGVGLIYLGPRALDGLNPSCPSYYFSLPEAIKGMRDGSFQTPYTPAVGVIFALQSSLSEILKDKRRYWALHEEVGRASRALLEGLGMRVLAREGFRSPSLTAFFPPEGVGAEELRGALKALGVELAGGQGRLSGKVLRLAHMGLPALESFPAFAFALCRALRGLGKEGPFGSALEAALLEMGVR